MIGLGRRTQGNDRAETGRSGNATPHAAALALVLVLWTPIAPESRAERRLTPRDVGVPKSYQVRSSNDGLGVWVWITPDESAVKLPRDAVAHRYARGDPETQPRTRHPEPAIRIACRAPLDYSDPRRGTEWDTPHGPEAAVTVERHPQEPDSASVFNHPLLWAWREATGKRIERRRVRAQLDEEPIAAGTFDLRLVGWTVTRQPHMLVIDGGSVLSRFERAAETGRDVFLRIEGDGVEMSARYETAGARSFFEAMRWHCNARNRDNRSTRTKTDRAAEQQYR